MVSVHADAACAGRFVHEAYLYASDRQFLAGAVPFVEAGLAAGEAVLVVVDREKIGALRGCLGPKAARVEFAEMRSVGRNPARIIPLWQDFVDENASTRGVRGIGEPVWLGRTPAELEECHLHEALLNVAFDDGPAWSLLCPYDTSRLPPVDVATAHRTHPHVVRDGRRAASSQYQRADAHPFSGRLPPPPPQAARLTFAADGLPEVRALVAWEAAAAALAPSRAQDLVLAACEVATNSIRHGGGGGTLHVWSDGTSLLCDVRDRGPDPSWAPMTGRQRARLDQIDGRGMWMANHLCDLVQVRTEPTGSTVRLHVRLDG